MNRTTGQLASFVGAFAPRARGRMAAGFGVHPVRLRSAAHDPATGFLSCPELPFVVQVEDIAPSRAPAP